MRNQGDQRKRRVAQRAGGQRTHKDINVLCLCLGFLGLLIKASSCKLGSLQIETAKGILCRFYYHGDSCRPVFLPAAGPPV